jgi:hypothetical protein
MLVRRGDWHSNPSITWGMVISALGHSCRFLRASAASAHPPKLTEPDTADEQPSWLWVSLPIERHRRGAALFLIASVAKGTRAVYHGSDTQ